MLLRKQTARETFAVKDKNKNHFNRQGKTGRGRVTNVAGRQVGR